MGHWDIYFSPSVCSSLWTFHPRELISMAEKNANKSAIAFSPEILGLFR